MVGIVEVFEKSTVTKVFVVPSLGKDVLLTKDVETVDISAIVVASSIAVVITVLKFVAAFADVVISAVEGYRVVDFLVGEKVLRP